MNIKYNNLTNNKYNKFSTYKKTDFDKYDNKISNMGKSKQYLLFI